MRGFVDQEEEPRAEMFWLWFLDLMWICDFDDCGWEHIPISTREIWKECPYWLIDPYVNLYGG